MEYKNKKNGIYNPTTYYRNKHTRKIHLLNSIHIWLVVSTPLKNISQLGVLFPIHGKIKNVPNHQPDIYSIILGHLGISHRFLDENCSVPHSFWVCSAMAVACDVETVWQRVLCAAVVSLCCYKMLRPDP
jgi:hypothetical protein